MIGGSVEVDARKALQKLARLSKAMEPSDLLDAIGQSQLNWVNKNFRKAGIEQKWPPLSENTVAAHRRGRGAGTAQPLRDSGRLAQSFIRRVTGDEVAVGTENKIAEYHHFGTGPFIIRPKKAKKLRFKTAKGMVFAKEVRHPGLPKRPLLPTKETAARMAVKVINAAVESADGAS